MQLEGFWNPDEVSACYRLRLSTLEIKINGVIAGMIFSVHFSGRFTSIHVTWYSSFREIPQKKVIEQFFLNPFFNVWSNLRLFFCTIVGRKNGRRRKVVMAICGDSTLFLKLVCWDTILINQTSQHISSENSAWKRIMLVQGTMPPTPLLHLMFITVCEWCSCVLVVIE